MEQKIADCAKLRAEKNLSIAFVESATAGWLCSEFALTEQSGQVLEGGITCYNADLKKSLLGVPHELIEKYTPESQEVTDELARRLGKLIPADIFVAVTGLTTPGGSETAEKPVGTMFVSALIKGHLFAKRYELKGKCEEIIKQTIIHVAALVVSHV
ncbi:CinA family protein [Mucilaginibacter ginsenosidivorax]|uniref:CinA family protein n=1 Tax=Mucilaginibacter ginsenosidivorax TaxID=862126 RepID=A0A5B8VSX4_9SPHI|nr:CinA family protein [Mucilaginibacter ginsenosidivorax]QEC74744.1 CinA family protein [Mucilaginibacter ginsenosidivorax]